jgi:acyl-coenzyme A synthetase/AMP-(fatty) acid ligase
LLVTELPTTPSGKVQKFRLLAALEAASAEIDTESNHA